MEKLNSYLKSINANEIEKDLESKVAAFRRLSFDIVNNIITQVETELEENIGEYPANNRKFPISPKTSWSPILTGNIPDITWDGRTAARNLTAIWEQVRAEDKEVPAATIEWSGGLLWVVFK